MPCCWPATRRPRYRRPQPRRLYVAIILPFTELTVRRNLTLQARLFHLQPRHAKQRIADLVGRFGLADYLNQPSSSLPLGIRQRLSLAVAIVHEPELLLLDEPTSGVDPLARDKFWELLIDLSRNQGVTIFVSTHFMNEAERCNRIADGSGTRVGDGYAEQSDGGKERGHAGECPSSVISRHDIETD